MSLLTDLYQVTMSQGYFRAGMHERSAVFHLFFRREPFGGNYAIACGLEPALQWLSQFHIDSTQTSYLARLTGNDGRSLFSTDFLKMLETTPLSLSVDAIPEGSLVFAHEPMLRVSGPLWQCQWVETALLNVINFQTLIATKAARVCAAAKGDAVLEFGLRRAQGVDGALAASRAAYVGGCAATSNVEAGLRYGIPVKGTHAHSWVMSFDSELEAFEAYADAMPNNCVFLVDTYDTIQGVRNAIAVGKKLRERGSEMVGVRLDSGDLAQLSIDARKLLDESGFEKASIVASNDLDELEIERLKQAGATIAVWGVGTNLVTAKDQPALGGVYKLAAIEDDAGTWQPKVKLSEQEIKTSNPGVLQVRRYRNAEGLLGDVIYSELIGPPEIESTVDRQPEDLLVPVLREGQRTDPGPSLAEVRSHALFSLDQLPAKHQKLSGGDPYPVRLEPQLLEQKQTLIESGRRTAGSNT